MTKFDAKEYQRRYQREYPKKKGFWVMKFAGYKFKAKQRGLEFSLPREVFIDKCQEECFYCGSPGPNGLDRLDNSKGYVLGNVVACCTRHNSMKSKMSAEEFFQECANITNYFKDWRSKMSRVVVTIEDKEDGNVRITAEPNFETLAMKVDSGNTVTAAETYALFALRKIREASKSLDRRVGRPIPDIN